MDDTRHCDRCEKDIKVKPMVVGQFWYLRGWTNAYGIKFTGCFCSKCYDALHRVKE